MIDEKHEFRMSAREVEYLKQLLSHDELLAGLLRFQEGPYGRITLQLSRTEAEQLRDYLTTQLALVGFEKDYSPNEQGQILERLIDKFFLR